MLRVGLTGGIATGKSTVAMMFIELGCHLIDADRITHELFQPGQTVYESVVQAFGDRILASDGRIDRKTLGEIVFSDPQARSKLNALVHPAVIQHQREWLNDMEAKDPGGIGIVDAALMIEVGTYKNYDRVIVVTCRPEIQKQRLRARSRLSDEEIEARLKKELARAESDIARVDAKLANEGFMRNAAEEVIEAEREKREEAEGRRKKLEEALARLRGAADGAASS